MLRKSGTAACPLPHLRQSALICGFPFAPGLKFKFHLAVLQHQKRLERPIFLEINPLIRSVRPVERSLSYLAWLNRFLRITAPVLKLQAGGTAAAFCRCKRVRWHKHRRRISGSGPAVSGPVKSAGVADLVSERPKSNETSKSSFICYGAESTATDYYEIVNGMRLSLGEQLFHLGNFKLPSGQVFSKLKSRVWH